MAMKACWLDEIGENLANGPRGFEREALRVNPSGLIAQTPHPSAFGSALTHNYITTDFSESLLEFVTPPKASATESMGALRDLHLFAYRNLGDELLWAGSMPGQVDSPEEIPLANYGSSNVGQLKQIYRRGLCHRYGRKMQAIAGVHFNYSLPASFWPIYRKLRAQNCPDGDFISTSYFNMIRNIRKYGWLLLYLFGASPAACRTFIDPKEKNLETLAKDTLFSPYATSLRMSDLGYKSDAQASLRVSSNCLSDYNNNLETAMNTSYPEYEKIGLKKDGEYRQLSTNILQVENEYYSLVRPKRVARSGQRPTQALREGGVQYIEVRALDVDIFEPLGIHPQTHLFMETFLIFCLLKNVPGFTEENLCEIQHNQLLTAREGRKPNLELKRENESISLTNWANEILSSMESISIALDAGSGSGREYQDALNVQLNKVRQPETTTSAKLLNTLTSRNISYSQLALNSLNNTKTSCKKKSLALIAAKY